MSLGPGDRLHLVDGSGFIFRAFHALPALTRKSDGLPVGAVSGFCAMLHKLIAEKMAGEAPTHIAVIFDHSAKTFRNAIYDGYKAHRPEPPEDLIPQFPLIREATRAFNLACIETEGYEADDIIATYARKAAAEGADVVIVSSDKDLMQLVDDRIVLFDGMKGQRLGREAVIEKFGVPPDKVVDVQALAGDSVDNVPGAPGIGIKTAAQLIGEYGDVEALLARAEEIKQPKRRQTLIDHAEQVRISRRLVELCDRVPDLPDFEDLVVQAPEPARLLGFLKALEFRTLTNRVAEALGADAAAFDAASVAGVPETGPDAAEAASGIAPGAPPAEPIDPASATIIRDADTLRAWVAEATEIGAVAIDTETTSLDEMVAELVGVSLALAPGRAAYVPLGHVDGDGDLVGAARLADGQIPLDEALAILRPMLEDPAVLKIGQNLKYDLKVLARHRIAVSPIDDTMLLSYAQGAGLHTHGMDALSKRLLDHEPIPIKALIGSGRNQITFDRVAIDKAAPYAAEDADITLRLHRVLKPGLVRERVATVYETLERPLVPVLAAMERHGVKVDRDALSRLSNTFAQRMAALEDEIHEMAGERFNVGSPKQLGEILFDRMSMQGGQKSSKTGAWVTDADTLEQLAAQGHDLPARVLDWRQLSKLKGTYTDALQGHINAETGRVHTSFSLAATTTGRLASTDPNLQNIPIRSEEGRRIREAFVAEPGRTLLSLDYSQIELRILAHIADIPELRQAFRDGLDIHAMTAAEMFGVPIEGMDPMIRRQAKAINFGVIYGISAFGLSNNLRIPQAEAKAFIDRYFERFPGIGGYMERTRDFARRHGHVTTLFGRKVHTPEINAKGPRAGFAYRAAINAPIQGTAADIIRRAMIRVPAALARERLSARMLLQVHDELLFEVPEDEAEATVACVRAVMEEAALPAVSLDVPLVVEAGTGPTWAAAH